MPMSRRRDIPPGDSPNTAGSPSTAAHLHKSRGLGLCCCRSEVMFDPGRVHDTVRPMSGRRVNPISDSPNTAASSTTAAYPPHQLNTRAGPCRRTGYSRGGGRGAMARADVLRGGKGSGSLLPPCGSEWRRYRNGRIDHLRGGGSFHGVLVRGDVQRASQAFSLLCAACGEFTYLLT